MRARNLCVLALAALAACVVPASADTIFNGGILSTASNWSNGLPSLGNNGSIAANGALNRGQTFNEAGPGTVTVSQASFDLSATPPVEGGDAYNYDWFISNIAVGGAVYNWNQSGGSVTTRILNVESLINYTLSGGSIQSTASGGARINQGGGTFTQTGGTVTGMGYSVGNGTTMSLSGGTAEAWGRDYTVGFDIRGAAGSTVSVSGNWAATVTTNVPAGNLALLDTDCKLIFDPGWTGSLTDPVLGTTRANWVAELTKTGVQVGSTQVTSGNFDSLFKITDVGGGSVSLVPEPSALVLLAIGLLGLLCYAWRKRR